MDRRDATALFYLCDQTLFGIYISPYPTVPIPIGFLAHIPWAVSAVGLQALGQNQRRLILLSFVLVYDSTLNQYYNLNWDYETPHFQGSHTNSSVCLPTTKQW